MKEFKVMRNRRRRLVLKSTRRRNKKLLLFGMTLCAVVLVGGICGVCFKLLSYSEPVSTPEVKVPAEPCVIENELTTSLILNSGETSILTVALEDESFDALEFSSSNEDVLTVDSGGRLDAKKEGEATITAQSKSFLGKCNVTVKKAQKEQKSSEYTTAFIANLDIVEKNKEDGSQDLYSVTVNRRTNTVTVYTYDDNGDYVVPVRAMVCSCGEFTDENITPTGDYSVYFKNRWHALFGDVYGQYVTGFSGHYLFHSVPYKQTSEDSLKADEFNKLGTNASQGCVRLMISDAKWIYDNIDMHTAVTVIDKTAGSDALGTPPVLKVDEEILWDPTDPNKNNPYKDSTPVISGVNDVTIKKDSDFDSKVTATDSCGQDITDRLEVVGNVVTSKVGTYYVTYSVTDDLGKTEKATMTVTVEK
ncbi:MAG: DUF5011 domain-containing protein [Ruminococcaceae bacterium]|nr:DUF5011 domain-containing protein [Oscillospiraceae bacterium]